MILCAPLRRREAERTEKPQRQRAMADLDVQRENEPVPEDYSMLEVVLWVVGIAMIPLVPIVMSFLFTPWSGM
jgi:hypothetical protein